MTEHFDPVVHQHVVGCSLCPWSEETFQWDARRRFKLHECTPPAKKAL